MYVINGPIGKVIIMATLYGIARPSYVYGHPKDGQDVLWRCTAQRYSVCIDPDFELYGTSKPEIQLRFYEVLKRTPCGAWINDMGPKKFVKLTAAKKYACNTVEEAIHSFIQRKHRHIAILDHQLKEAREDRELAEQIANDMYGQSVPGNEGGS